MKVGIAHFCIEYQFSGEAESLRNLTLFLNQYGHEVRDINSRQIERQRHSRYENSFLKLINLISSPWKMRRFSKSVDVIQLFLPSPAFSWIGDLCCIFSKSPVIINFDGHCCRGGDIKLCKINIDDLVFFLPRILFNNYILAQLTNRRAKKYVISSLYQKKELKKLGYSDLQIETIPNLSDPSRYKAIDKTIACQELGFKSPTVGYIGHLFSVKGVEHLLNAFNLTPPNLKLAIADSGLGNKKRQVTFVKHSCLQERVFFIGKVNVSCFFSAIDVLVLPYLASFGTFMWPNTLIESFYIGVPLILPELEIFSELKNYGQVAWFCDIKNPKILAQTIQNLLEDKDAQLEMIKSQKKACHDLFDPDRSINQFNSLYREVLA